jgi:hypothetical protein
LRPSAIYRVVWQYHWRKRLGNELIKEGGLKIFDPTAVDDLLQLIENSYRQRRCMWCPPTNRQGEA